MGVCESLAELESEEDLGDAYSAFSNNKKSNIETLRAADSVIEDARGTDGLVP